MNVGTFLFKSLRRQQLFLNKVKSRFYLKQYQYLYSSRFKFDKTVSLGKAFKINFDDSLSVMSVRENVQFRDFCNLFSGGNGSITIGKNNFFNNFCSLNSLGEIKIGDNCQFGEAVRFYDHNHKFTESGILISEQGYTIGKIIIGNNCWIGSNAVILKDVSIGDNVIIGAGCIIRKSVLSNTVLINKQELISKIV